MKNIVILVSLLLNIVLVVGLFYIKDSKMQNIMLLDFIARKGTNDIDAATYLAENDTEAVSKMMAISLYCDLELYPLALGEELDEHWKSRLSALSSDAAKLLRKPLFGQHLELMKRKVPDFDSMSEGQIKAMYNRNLKLTPEGSK